MIQKSIVRKKFNPAGEQKLTNLSSLSFCLLKNPKQTTPICFYVTETWKARTGIMKGQECLKIVSGVKTKSWGFGEKKSRFETRFFGNMTCPHSREQKGKAQHLRLENAAETQQMASPDRRRLRGSVQRGQEEKSQCPGAADTIGVCTSPP